MVMIIERNKGLTDVTLQGHKYPGLKMGKEFQLGLRRHYSYYEVRLNNEVFRQGFPTLMVSTNIFQTVKIDAPYFSITRAAVRLTSVLKMNFVFK